MKRARVILVAGLLAAVAAYVGFYCLGSAGRRCLADSTSPELAWLKAEFHLSNAEFERICKLHDEYLPGCKDLCRRIDGKNTDLKKLLAATNAVTPEIEKTLAEAAQLRVECQARMLRHFYAVSQTMPPEQGRRYLVWMQEKTLIPTFHSPHEPEHTH